MRRCEAGRDAPLAVNGGPVAHQPPGGRMSYPTGPRRYRLVRLSDGRIHATDNVDGSKAYFLTPRPATRARYPLARAGELLVEAGRMSGVSGYASASGYSVTRLVDGTIRLVATNDPARQLSIAPTGAVSPRGHFAVLDARDGTLLLLDEKGIHELSVSPTRPTQAALDGSPIFQYADDFAP